MEKLNEATEYSYICNYCHKIFKPNHPKQIYFCGKKCYKKWAKINDKRKEKNLPKLKKEVYIYDKSMDDMNKESMIPCHYCGTLFLPKNNKDKYCSLLCKAAGRKKITLSELLD